ncbi:DUF2384 domain-containing protein [Xanthobacter flavus]|uniref:DUF2384 domain-containing protein n=1 Tax=Xanthobacter flavus TaxID=281 RepID=UPI001AE9E6D2|nr:DUF2384 domain-containing protein [Xanthobacter flavus]MBP2148425.1 hypothetical protein [Xanthobacter flavus]
MTFDTLELQFLAKVTLGGDVEPSRLSSQLGTTLTALAPTLGLSRDSVSKQARIYSIVTQRRLREFVDIIVRTTPWAGSPIQAFAWYRGQSLPSFGDLTAEELVKMGRADEVKDYLGRIALGGFA